MKLLFKQRFLTWPCSYDIFDQNGNTVYKVEGQLSWGHCLKIYDTAGNELATVKEKVFTIPKTFDIYLGNNYAGCICKEMFTLFRPKYDIDFIGWHIEGEPFEWDYEIIDPFGEHVATISKELFNLTDTYSIDINDPKNALCALMLVTAIDAEKCSRN